ncbi:MAG: hypothetical protein JST89_13730 [Cyanobacteria bacterium SZAS-4]|nr:hypothetical protein [Cyanobacteria bacterium SZAS-4]
MNLLAKLSRQIGLRSHRPTYESLNYCNYNNITSYFSRQQTALRLIKITAVLNSKNGLRTADVDDWHQANGEKKRTTNGDKMTKTFEVHAMLINVSGQNEAWTDALVKPRLVNSLGEN